MSAKVVSLRRADAAAEPAGLRASVPVAGSVRNLRRRRGERRREPRAFRPRQSLRHTPAVARDWRRRGPLRCGPRVCDTEHIVRGGGRIGIYFAETGASQRASTVIYDRAHSSISEMPPDAVDWDRVMDGAAWFHVTGITPALGDQAVAATKAAIAAARRAGARVSVDLNYRKKLWTEQQAQATMRPLMRDVDVVIANEEDLQSVLGVHVAGADVVAGALNIDGVPGCGRARHAGLRTGACGDHAARKLVGQRQRLERRAVGRSVNDPAPEPALRRPTRRSNRRRRQLCRGPDLRADHGPIRTRMRFASRSPRAR